MTADLQLTTVYPDDFFSSLFVRLKKDGMSYRTIFSLKSQTQHFKIESIKQVTNMITPGFYMVSLDIKDAFYYVPINENHRKFRKFSWQGVAYLFKAMPNGYIDAMRVFTKILKTVFEYLREKRLLILQLYMLMTASLKLAPQKNAFQIHTIFNFIPRTCWNG